MGEDRIAILSHDWYYRDWVDLPKDVLDHKNFDHPDSLETDLLVRHLRALWGAAQFNWRIEGYYHWSLVDNFEWKESFAARFGLISLDIATGQRTLTQSGRLFGEIVRSGGITQAMLQRYAAELIEKTPA